jgi:hypothetical protein
VARFDLDPLSFDPSRSAQSPQDGIQDSLDDGDSSHFLEAVANLRPIKWPVPQASKNCEIEGPLAELALPHLDPDPLSVRSTIDSNVFGNHAASLSQNCAVTSAKR